MGFFCPGRIEPKDAVKLPDYIVLNCFRLAQRFKCDPDVFLDKSISMIGKYLTRCDQLDEKDRIEEEWQARLAQGG